MESISEWARAHPLVGRPLVAISPFLALYLLLLWTEWRYVISLVVLFLFGLLLFKGGGKGILIGGGAIFFWLLFVGFIEMARKKLSRHSTNQKRRRERAWEKKRDQL